MTAVRRAGLSLALACLLLPGCGGDDSEQAATPAATPTPTATPAPAAGAEEKEVEDVIRRYLTALAEPDGEKACSYLSDTGKAQAAKAAGVPTCEAAVDKAKPVLDEATSKLIAEAQVTDVEIDGDKARAKIERATRAVELEREDGTWRISGGLAPPG